MRQVNARSICTMREVRFLRLTLCHCPLFSLYLNRHIIAVWIFLTSPHLKWFMMAAPQVAAIAALFSLFATHGVITRPLCKNRRRSASAERWLCRKSKSIWLLPDVYFHFSFFYLPSTCNNYKTPPNSNHADANSDGYRFFLFGWNDVRMDGLKVDRRHAMMMIISYFSMLKTTKCEFHRLNPLKGSTMVMASNIWIDS